MTTNPTITWDHGYFFDCDDDTGWGETESSLPSTLTVLHGDIFQIEGAPDDAGDEYVHYEKDITNFSTNTYTKYVVRSKTSVSSNGLKPYISWQFTAGFQDIALDFSTRWKVSTGTITASKTVDKIRLAATDDPDALAAGTYQVYYDFVLACRNIFTFPHVKKIYLKTPQKLAQLEIPGRAGDIIQKLGMKSPEIVIEGDMKAGETWGDTTLTYGEILMRIMNSSDPWQWLEFSLGSEDVGFKVTPNIAGLELELPSNEKGVAGYRCPFIVTNLSDLLESTWADLQWMGIE